MSVKTKQIIYQNSLKQVSAQQKQNQQQITLYQQQQAQQAQKQRQIVHVKPHPQNSYPKNFSTLFKDYSVIEPDCLAADRLDNNSVTEFDLFQDFQQYQRQSPVNQQDSKPNLSPPQQQFKREGSTSTLLQIRPKEPQKEIPVPEKKNSSVNLLTSYTRPIVPFVERDISSTISSKQKSFSTQSVEHQSVEHHSELSMKGETGSVQHTKICSDSDDKAVQESFKYENAKPENQNQPKPNQMNEKLLKTEIQMETKTTKPKNEKEEEKKKRFEKLQKLKKLKTFQKERELKQKLKEEPKTESIVMETASGSVVSQTKVHLNQINQLETQNKVEKDEKVKSSEVLKEVQKEINNQQIIEQNQKVQQPEFKIQEQKEQKGSYRELFGKIYDQLREHGKVSFMESEKYVSDLNEKIDIKLLIFDVLAGFGLQEISCKDFIEKCCLAFQ